MTYSKIYEHLLAEVKTKIDVYHRTFGDDLDGFYDAHYNYIIINKRLKNTRRGVRALAHEYTHFLDKKAGKFTKFFSTDKRKYTEERMREVVDAEQSAGIGAAKICEKYGKKYKPEETNPKELPKLIKFWKKFYFYKNQ